MRTVLCILLVGALSLVAAPETNVTGTWSGSFTMTGPNGETNDGSALLLLKQAGTEITGTVGPNDGEQHPIKTGKIAGDKITLLVEDEGRVINFDLVIAADRIKGDVKISRDGQTATAKLDVTRAK
jgi:hypothetical protein